jgi:hypothetical protein
MFHIFYLFNFKLQNLGEIGVVLHKPSLKMKKLGESEMVWLDQRFSQPSLGPSVSSFCMLGNLMLCNVLVEDLECVLVMLERSSPHLFLYLSLFAKETIIKTNNGSSS